MRDGEQEVIRTVYDVAEIYPTADARIAPDLLIGYADGYRASWATAEGTVAMELFEDNHDRWSGDHCIAHDIVPGILVTNRTVVVADPTLSDLAATIPAEFGIAPPPDMAGRPLFGPPRSR